MFALAIAVTLASTGPVRLAAPGLSGVQLSKELTDFYSEHFAQQLSLEGLSVLTAKEVNSMLGLEREKQLVGCADNTGCMAELASAMGVDGVVTGSIGRFDTLFQINLRVVAAADGRKLGIYSGTANSEGEVISTLKLAAASIHEQVMVSMGRTAPSAGVRRFWWAPAAGTVVFAGLGALLLGMTSANVAALRGTAGMPSMLTALEAQRALSAGLTERTLGFVSCGLAGAALLGTVAVIAFGGPVSVSPSVGGGGGGFVLTGSFP